MFKEPKDAELDIEHLQVQGIERIGKNTVIVHVVSNTEKYETRTYRLRCTMEKHNELVARFRKKLSLPASS
jgi:hypothetical protein